MSRPMNSLRLCVLAVALGFAGSVLAAANDFPTTPPAPGLAPKLTIPTPSSQKLDNGLEVVSVRRADLPLVTAQLVLRSGGEVDPANEAGLADLTATLLTRGAAGKTAPQIAAEAEALGGSLNSGSGWDQSGVDITVTTPKLSQALALLAEVVRQPDFSADELKRAQSQAIDDLQLQLSQPNALASIAINRAVFGSGAYGHSRSGTPTSIARINRADVQKLHATYYRPDNAILVLGGDITPEQARQLAQARFGDWKAPATPLPATPQGRRSSTLPALVMIDQHGAGQASVVAAHAAPPRSDKDYMLGTVANAVLGGSYSARLNEEIRIKRGLSYGATSRLAALRDAGIWVASAQTKNDSAPQVVGLMREQFARLGTTPVPAAELAARKATLIGGYGRSLETTAGLAARVAELAVYGVDLGEISRYIDQVQAVTPDQIAAYASQHLSANATRFAVAGDAKQFATTLSKDNPTADLIEASALDMDSPNLRPAKPAASSSGQH